MKSFRDSCIKYFRDCNMPGRIVAQKDNEISITFKLESIPQYIIMKILFNDENKIIIRIWGIGCIRNPQNFQGKLIVINKKYNKYKIFINDENRELLIERIVNEFNWQLLYQEIMAVIPVVEAAYEEFKEKPLELIETIRAATVSELVERIMNLDGAVRLGFEIGLNVYEGLCIRYAGYRKEIHEFCDAFGFMPDNDVTVYKHTVYIYDENEDKKFLGIFSGTDCKQRESKYIVSTIADLLEKLKIIFRHEENNIQILSPDGNFELKGSITLGVCFQYKEDPESSENWLILEG